MTQQNPPPQFNPSDSNVIQMKANATMLYALTYSEITLANMMGSVGNLIQKLSIEEVEVLAAIYNGTGYNANGVDVANSFLAIAMYNSIGYHTNGGNPTATFGFTVRAFDDPGWKKGTNSGDLDETQAAAQVYTQYDEMLINGNNSALQTDSSQEQQMATSSQNFAQFAGLLSQTIGYLAEMLAGSL